MSRLGYNRRVPLRFFMKKRNLKILKTGKNEYNFYIIIKLLQKKLYLTIFNYNYSNF